MVGLEAKDFGLDLKLEMMKILQMETETEAGVQINKQAYSNRNNFTFIGIGY